MNENIKLYQGDCLEIMDKLIADGVKVDLILTDPPYGITACKWDSVIDFDEMWKRLKRLRDDSTPIVLFGSEPFSSALRMSNIKEYKYDWIWNKVNSGGFATAKYKPLSVFEQILVFGNGRIAYYPIMEQAEEKNKRPRNKSYATKDEGIQNMKSGVFQVSKNHNEDLRYPKNLLVYNNRVGDLNNLKRVHPTQKPVDLLEYLIKTYTDEGETVLDFTMGSGSTGVACVNTNRNFIGIELDENYFKIAEDRIHKANDEKEIK